MVSYRNLDDQRATPPPLLRAVVVGGGAPPKRIEMERSGPIDTDSNAVWKTYTSYSGNVTEACRAHLESADRLDVQQTLHGCFQELCCEARTEFRYFNTKGMNIAESMEDTNCCCRICCGSVHPFTMRVTEMGTEAELLTVERPCACAAAGCKFCCFQTAKYTSGGNEIGSIRETCYCCVPSFRIANGSGQDLFFLHPPTCCCGMCIHCCTEGNPCCGSGVCKVPFWIFDAADDDDDDDGKDSPSHRHRRRRRPNTNGSGAAHIGKILKKPKSTVTELFTDASAFEVHFPVAATVEQKAVLVGTAIFLNAVFFEDAGF